jgi:hypothetical protein
MKVLVVLEDPTLEQYIVKPILEKMFDSLDQAAQVDVLTNPYMRGVNDGKHPALLGLKRTADLRETLLAPDT